MSEQRSNFVTRAVEWLRAGYPDGVPRHDYVALLGLLRRKLTEDEIRRIARELAARSAPGDDAITSADIEEMISHQLLQEATPADVVRVSAHLAAGGWPLADPPAE
ncbi:DUF3349 domain-containing protein [Actinoplanes teichomyceticus]|uniref:Uncharacterized protein DUF3349 n=1 Tax=Actinoplanes teichomyceticus TaxID=1867 RepID=A0A561WJY7_ACTTI|nr:DUF3349 domain-containing protein [Actinoplanes teichomyceticus]TWG24177.1 uncharacterized protein DUF3349 [Actinoplanes teichomyceticus]GIF12976.1 hypothetical protein Ate01nite_30080 [Actinoplanes teichomyceticus]